jgi:hypothetical protein
MSPEKRSKKEPAPPSSANEAAARLAQIVEAAERAAAKVIDDAEEEAQRRVEQAEERGDRIVAERLRAIADELDPEERVSSRGAPHLKPVESPAEVEDREDDEDDELARRRAGAAGARLLATQMAVSGASRAEIEAKLQSDFEIEDTSGILEAILGPEE